MSLRNRIRHFHNRQLNPSKSGISDTAGARLSDGLGFGRGLFWAASETGLTFQYSLLKSCVVELWALNSFTTHTSVSSIS